jgi:hypothetical protein
MWLVLILHPARATTSAAITFPLGSTAINVSPSIVQPGTGMTVCKERADSNYELEYTRQNVMSKSIQ